MKKRLLIIFLIILTSCSVFSDNTVDNPDVREVLLNVSARYFINIVNGDFSEISSLMVWDIYSDNNDNKISKQKYFKLLSMLDGRYNIKNHPLLNLKAENFKINDNDARITFTKEGQDDVVLKFMWAGSAWLITDDNLFGEDEYFDKLKPISEKQKSKPDRIRQKRLDAQDLEL